MEHGDANRRRLSLAWRFVIEVALVLFLLYSVRLMEEFRSANLAGNSLAFALADIFTPATFVIAMISAMLASVVLEYLRSRP